MRVFQLSIISTMCLLLLCEPVDAQNITQYQPDVAYDCYKNGELSAGCKIDCWDHEAGGTRDGRVGDIMAPSRNVVRVEMYFSKDGGKDTGGKWWMFVKRFDANNGIYSVDNYLFGPNVECKVDDVVAGGKSQNISGWKIDAFNWGR